MSSLLDATRPFIQATALLFALLGAIKGLQELIPALAFINIRGSAQTYAQLAGALSLAVLAHVPGRK